MTNQAPDRPAPLSRIAEWRGVQTLRNDELISLLLDSGTRRSRALAIHVLDVVGPLQRLGRFSARGLNQATELSFAQALRLLCACELGQRTSTLLREAPPSGVLSHERVAEWAIPRLGGLEHEEVWVLTVDARAVMRSRFQVGRGGAHGCALLPKDILTPVVRAGALGFVLVHNHPSGDPRPSREDLMLTATVKQAAEIVGAPLIDHVIVGGGSTVSLLSAGHLDKVGPQTECA